MDHLLFGDLREAVRRVDPVELVGRVTRAVGLMVESIGPDVRLGETVRIVSDDGEVLAEVVGFEGERVRLMPLGKLGRLPRVRACTPCGARTPWRWGQTCLAAYSTG